jgi:hypothetical protein
VTPEDKENGGEPEPRPPGQFMDERIEADTRRFLEQARELARRRARERPWEENGE